MGQTEVLSPFLCILDGVWTERGTGDMEVKTRLANSVKSGGMLEMGLLHGYVYIY